MKHMFRLFALTLAMVLLTTAAFAYPPGFLVYHGDREVNKIAITVDDCYDANVLRMMHELCVEYDFPITWFVLGTQIRDEDKELWEAIIAHGSEIGNHTWKHPYLTRIKIHNARNQILLTQERLDELLGYHYPLRLLRPPFGYYQENGVNLLPMFYEYGVEKTSYNNVQEEKPIDDTNKFFTYDPSLCILCHRCVNTCKEIVYYSLNRIKSCNKVLYKPNNSLTYHAKE